MNLLQTKVQCFLHFFAFPVHEKLDAIIESLNSNPDILQWKIRTVERNVKRRYHTSSFWEIKV